MISRRNFLGSMSAASLACMVRKTFGLPASVDPFRTPAAENAVDNTSRVKIAIGTGGHGHTYPAATLPFGAVQLGPDTGTGNWDHCSGYHYADSSILGFSHTHLEAELAALTCWMFC